MDARTLELAGVSLVEGMNSAGSDAFKQLKRPDQLKRIYEWVKTDHVNLKEFKDLIGQLND